MTRDAILVLNKSAASTTGFTALDGLPMGTRCTLY
ncbi:acetate kinase [Paraburkholderia sp. EB58]|jgi:acetate kinase